MTTTAAPVPPSRAWRALGWIGGLTLAGAVGNGAVDYFDRLAELRARAAASVDGRGRDFMSYDNSRIYLTRGGRTPNVIGYLEPSGAGLCMLRPDGLLPAVDQQARRTGAARPTAVHVQGTSLPIYFHGATPVDCTSLDHPLVRGFVTITMEAAKRKYSRDPKILS